MKEPPRLSLVPGSQTEDSSPRVLLTTDFRKAHGFAAVGVALEDLQLETGLSDLEMLQAVSLWTSSVLKHLLAEGPAGGDLLG